MIIFSLMLIFLKIRIKSFVYLKRVVVFSSTIIWWHQYTIVYTWMKKRPPFLNKRACFKKMWHKHSIYYQYYLKHNSLKLRLTSRKLPFRHVWTLTLTDSWEVMKEQEKWNRKNVMEDHLLDLPTIHFGDHTEGLSKAKWQGQLLKRQVTWILFMAVL